MNLKSGDMCWEAIDAQGHFPWSLLLSSPCPTRYFTIVLPNSTPRIHCKSVIVLIKDASR